MGLSLYHMEPGCLRSSLVLGWTRQESRRFEYRGDVPSGEVIHASMSGIHSGVCDLLRTLPEEETPQRSKFAIYGRTNTNLHWHLRAQSLVEHLTPLTSVVANATRPECQWRVRMK